MIAPQEEPKSHLVAYAPRCGPCKTAMKVRTLFPGREVNDVTYRCDDCGAEVMRSVLRPR